MELIPLGTWYINPYSVLRTTKFTCACYEPVECWKLSKWPARQVRNAAATVSPGLFFSKPNYPVRLRLFCGCQYRLDWACAGEYIENDVGSL